MLTQARILEVLKYNKRTGTLRWKAKSCLHHSAKIGSVAGSVDIKGYLKIMIDGERHMAHRLIWVMMTGEWPKNLIDHKNGKKADNRWSNLREATDSQNKANGGAYKCNSSGIKGAYYEPGRTSYKKWRAVIRKDGRLKHIGYFSTPEEANKAFALAAAKLHGEFARSI